VAATAGRGASGWPRRPGPKPARRHGRPAAHGPRGWGRAARPRPGPARARAARPAPRARCHAGPGPGPWPRAAGHRRRPAPAGAASRAAPAAAPGAAEATLGRIGPVGPVAPVGRSRSRQTLTPQVLVGEGLQPVGVGAQTGQGMQGHGQVVGVAAGQLGVEGGAAVQQRLQGGAGPDRRSAQRLGRQLRWRHPGRRKGQGGRGLTGQGGKGSGHGGLIGKVGRWAPSCKLK
jgi:hypothetical protein